MRTAFDSLSDAPVRSINGLWGWLPWFGSGGSKTGTPKAKRKSRSDSEHPDRPTVGLALSSGGAKGLAHIGVIQVLEENGIEIDAVSGTSMGAYVAAMWASGLNGRQLEGLAAEMQVVRDLWSLVDPIAWPRRGFIRGHKIEHRLRATLGVRTFDELDFPLYLLATKLETFERVVFDEGDVASAVLASLAIPGIVAPVTRDGVEYVDGGVCDPLPVAVLREKESVDLVIAINVLPSIEEFHNERHINADCEKRPLWQRPFCWLNRQVNWFAKGNLLDILRSSAMASQMRMVEHSSEKTDVLIRPVDSEARWHDYTAYARYIEVGRKAAEEALPEIKALVSGQAPKSETLKSSKEGDRLT